MSPFRRWLKRGSLALAGVLLALTSFLLWGSSGTLADEDLATVSVYDPAGFASPAETLTVVSYNIGYLSGMTNNRAVRRTHELFANNLDAAVQLLSVIEANLVALQEIDFGAERSFNMHQLDSLAYRLDYATAAVAVNWDERYVPFPYGWPSVHFGRVLSGQAVLSRHPIRRHERSVLERPPTPFYYDAFYLDRLAQVVEVDVGRPLLIINVHLEAWHTDTRERQAEAVRALYDRYRDHYPVLVLGDFNSVLPSSKATLPADRQAYFAEDRTIEILLRDADLREVTMDGHVLPSTQSAGLDAVATYPADAPRVRIDHVFYEASDLVPVETFVIDGPHQPSDHRAVVARFVFKDSATDHPPNP